MKRNCCVKKKIAIDERRRKLFDVALVCSSAMVALVTGFNMTEMLRKKVLLL